MNRVIFALFVALGGFFAWLAYYSTDLAGGEDGVMHHLFARYVPQHPENLLNLWAKPAFTLLSMPFAQLGFFGSQLFNIIAGLLTAWLTWKSAERLGQEKSWVAIIFLVFSIQYFFAIPSAITEILFSLLLVLSLFFLLKEHYIFAALAISFIPYARTEGNVLILMFAIALASIRQWKAIPLVFAGSLIYSVAGYLTGKDFFWIWTEHPYTDASLIYGHGTWYHYVAAFRNIWGFPLTLLVLIGTCFFIAECMQVLRGKKPADRTFMILLFAVFGSFYAYLAGHSYVWYKGYSGSLGLIRVMAGTMPLAALIGLYGLNRMLYYLNPNLRILKQVLAFVAVFCVIYTCFASYRLPFNGDEERKQILAAGKWYKSSPYYGKHKVYYFAPSAAVAFGVDPFDFSERGELSNTLTDKEMPVGSIIVWDAHFGPNESQLPVDSIRVRNDFEEIAHFKPDFDLRTLNNYEYEIFLFRKK